MPICNKCLVMFVAQAEIQSKCSKESKDRVEAANLLGIHFSELPDRDQAWKDLHILIQDKNRWVRDESAKALILAFGQVPNKDQAGLDLHTLAHDVDRNVRLTAAKALISVFSQIPEKYQAWQDLVTLTQDEDDFVRREAAKALISVFSQVPEKYQAWQDLVKLTQDEYSWVRADSAKAMISAFGLVPDKYHAWQDLHSLTKNEDRWSREYAVEALISVFSQIPDKGQAWQDLIKLTKDEDRTVRRIAAKALISAFSQVPDRDQICQDLQRLTQENDSYVRMYAYHSLGRSCILKATDVEANDKIKLQSELEAAVAYFEKSSQEDWFGPARFCHPFYRTYLAITFQETKENEVQRYLAEAKEAVGRSECRDELLKAVESLAVALQKSQRLKDRSIEEVASELNAYQWYCEKAADYLVAAENKAPGTVKLLRKCNPLIEEKIKSTISGIQEKARSICQITHGSGTVYETPGAELQEAAKGLSTGDLASVQKYSSNIVWQLKKFCCLLPPEDKEQVCSIVEEIVHEADFPVKLHKVLTALLCLSPILEDKSTSFQKDEESLQRIEAKLDVIHENTKYLGVYFNNIEFAILNLKDSSGNTTKHLLDIKNDIDKLQREIEAQCLSEKELVYALEDRDHSLIERLTKMQENISRAVRDNYKLNASKEDLEEILNKLDEQERIKKRDVLSIISDISQLLQIGLKIYLTHSII
jgi:HEAT repeat protein